MLSRPKYDLAISIVLSDPNELLLRKTLASIRQCTLRYKLYIVDNSALNRNDLVSEYPDSEYIFNNGNIGFGRAHNVALKKSVEEAPYHLVLNPDVSFPPGTLEKIFAYMETAPDAGMLLPKVCNEKGEVQHLAKRLPNPLDLVIRRTNSKWLFSLFQRQLRFYEMRDRDYTSSFVAPFLSGCFMFVRTATLMKTGFFDERFFLYMEDVDLSRRLFSAGKNVFYPDVTIFHEHSRGSYRRTDLLLRHIHSAVKYFNKWGWVFDSDRERINRGVY